LAFPKNHAKQFFELTGCKPVPLFGTFWCMAFKPFDREAERTTYRRHLPHWKQPGCTYFVTFRLADSLPKARLDEWRVERDAWLKARGLRSVDELDRLPLRERRIFRQTFTRRMHEWLDAGYGSCLLREPRHALIVADALRFFDEKRCALGDFVVMPNHVHLLVTPFADWPLQTLLHSWKRFTAREINKLLSARAHCGLTSPSITFCGARNSFPFFANTSARIP
jgi:REP element-mobilizing transposase RayT